MRETSFLLAVLLMTATFATALGQPPPRAPENTTFFDFDFSANDQFTADAEFRIGSRGGIFSGRIDNRGPFVDGPLANQVGWNSTALSENMIVDTARGFVRETATSPTTLPNTNVFIGQPLIFVGDTVRLISEISFTKNLVADPSNSGNLIEVNSAADNFFFGFRGGIGTDEFAPNAGVSQSFRYDVGPSNTDDSDSSILAFATVNRVSSAGVGGDDNIASAPVSALGIDIANGDFETDIFRIVSDAVVTASDATTITFEVTTSIQDQSGNVLGTTPAATTAVDTAISLANNRIQFAIRDGSSTPGDPTALTIHRLAAIFNPTESMPLKGDVNLNGVIDFLDIQAFISVLQTGSFQAEADCDCNGAVNFLDIREFVTILQGG